MKPMIATMLICISPLLICAEDSAGSTSHLAIQVKPDSMPAATPLLSPAICGKSNLLFKLGEQAIGNEAFEIKCRPDGGYSATAHTELKVPGASTDLNTTIELDKSGSPRYLKPGACVVLEIGFSQLGSISSMLGDGRLELVDTTHDLQGIPRTICIRRVV